MRYSVLCTCRKSSICMTVKHECVKELMGTYRWYVFVRVGVGSKMDFTNKLAEEHAIRDIGAPNLLTIAY